MEWYEAAFDRYYPVLYGHRDAEEASLVVRTFASFLAGRTPVLDVASGNGRYLKALLAGGHDAYGLDLSHYLLRQSAEGDGHRGRLVQGDMRRLPFADGAFGAVINMFTSFGYFSTDTDNLLVLREIHRVLEAGGGFLFDFINASRVSASLLGETRRESSGYSVHERRAVEDHGKYLVKRATIHDPDSATSETIVERLRLYTNRDLRVMLQSVGLTVLGRFGDYNGNEFVESVSERVIFTCEKP
jgi:SAM-dependent methyltransferase